MDKEGTSCLGGQRECPEVQGELANKCKQGCATRILDAPVRRKRARMPVQKLYKHSRKHDDSGRIA